MIRQVVKFGTLAVVAGTLSGCAYLRAVTFESDEDSAIEQPQKTSVYLLRAEQKTLVEQPLASLPIPKELIAPMKECLRIAEPQPTAGALVPALVGFFVDYGITALTDALAARVDELAQKGSKTYSANAIVSDEKFDDAECILLVRETAPPKHEDPPPPASAKLYPFGLGLILEKEFPCDRADKPCGGKDNPFVSDEAVILKPFYLKMYNAVAITERDKPVDVSVAVTAKAAYTTKDAMRKVDVFGTTTFTIAKVELGAENQKGRVKASGLFPQAPTNASAVELAVAVTESGSGVPKGVKEKAELEALKKALGPILVEKAKSLVE